MVYIRLIFLKSSAAVTLAGLMCCVFRDSLQHTTVVMCAYLVVNILTALISLAGHQVFFVFRTLFGKLLRLLWETTVWHQQSFHGQNHISSPF